MIVSRRFVQASAAAAATLACLATAMPAHAAVATYYFNGNCDDCALAAGTATFAVSATLTLSDYVEGTALEDSDFFYFIYNGSNLLDPYLVSINGEPVGANNFSLPYTHEFRSMSGNIMPGGSQSLDLRFGDRLLFKLDTGGNWITCGGKQGVGNNAVPCPPNDYGVGRFTSAIPEPGSQALLGLGLAALLVRLQRRGA